MRKFILALFLFVSFVLFADAPKYVFLFIGDGMAVTQRHAAEEFSKKIGRGPLLINSFPCKGLTATRSANRLVTDSAAAATAIACGEKTKNYTVGRNAEGKDVYSSAVAAKEAGKKVGIISTVTITHATPAAFYAHRAARGEGYGIAIDLVHSGFDFFAGGGLDGKYKDSKAKEFKKYGHAYKYAESKGYKIVRTKKDFLALKPSDGRILTRMTDGPLPYTIDIGEENPYPTLAELVAKGIEMLDNSNGFFMMAEGGRIDWAGHANDAATNVRETLAFDDAVKVALEFYEKHPKETLIVVTGDHETGGLTMGVANTGYSIDMGMLRYQTMSAGAFTKRLSSFYKKNPSLTIEDVKPLVEKAFGIVFDGLKDNLISLTDKERTDFLKAFESDMKFLKAKKEENRQYDGPKRYILGTTLSKILERRAGVAWSTGGHTAQSVLTTAIGCEAQLFNAPMDNTDIAKKIKSFYGK
ncbi:MAG: alkaline phosphatase [Kiritimatiellae bacterium]|nr:alkaline phosphatase [Kiritimatiellia bacterium]